MSEGRWVSRARGSKGARVWGRVRRTCGRGHVHGGEIVGERLGMADRWGRQDKESEGARGGENGTDSSAPQSSEREREGVSTLGLAPIGEARLSGTEGARARARAGWA
jgi:hypothetical protein